ncbi:Unconventional myosin-XV [Strongyloides ratti]|uniref:Unconventional myosin-XV n=1 Tax=Strongyloides ratti TaxID=34506 RepID=A0A090KX84_STRRB|nr:Unconventional myosin-XV [Strongyloides ratti]CEF59852.1 Unconventional myosin-XV [Strongyloides ratti]
MAEFAINYFQKQKRGTEIGTLFKKKDKDWTWKDISNLIKYSSKPITNSLLLLNDNELQKKSVDSFMCIMRYMGDENLKKNQTITDCVYELLTICKENPPLHDEIYCQMMKQLTNNTSKVEDSLLKGWRLFTIITSYFTPSDILKPYLLNYIKIVAFDKNRSCHQTAKTCLKNLEQTFKYGGRQLLLSASEVEAITKGKYVKRQPYLLPGGHKMFINTIISTVAEDLIKHICREMNIYSINEQQEFSLCYLIENENNMKIISNNQYILDITTKMTLEKKKIMLVLKRFVWISPLRFDNNLFIDAMFYQILPDYISGLYIINCDKKSLTVKDLSNFSLMGALIHYSDSIGMATTVKSDCIESLVPSIILRKYSQITLHNWANRILEKINEWDFEMTPIHAKSLFLITLQNYYLFSATFYHVKKVIKNDTPINELMDGILAINKNGLTFLDEKNRNIIIKIHFDEIDHTDFDSQDYKLSILMPFNNMITLITDAGDDIAKMIHHYVYICKF